MAAIKDRAHEQPSAAGSVREKLNEIGGRESAIAQHELTISEPCPEKTKSTCPSVGSTASTAAMASITAEVASETDGLISHLVRALLVHLHP